MITDRAHLRKILRGQTYTDLREMVAFTFPSRDAMVDYILSQNTRRLNRIMRAYNWDYTIRGKPTGRTKKHVR